MSEDIARKLSCERIPTVSLRVEGEELKEDEMDGEDEEEEGDENGDSNEVIEVEREFEENEDPIGPFEDEVNEGEISSMGSDSGNILSLYSPESMGNESDDSEDFLNLI
ncbi:hypothetical protein PRIPAC_70111 [Pristionchus pacificus]|uniref:Uncharacterized protein n=1 Tax=Pristionchus pacificus TaxID=54126 RepID=A0A2A6CZW1_PRIPA|nr:hypothetical protein PRIPAC_70111 [Pristionchus pacificus]|eukprot:PDM83679.1 hypothetical protein PRIPAC_30166 [Pristionchus pacificus]